MNTEVYELARAAREQGLCGLLGAGEGLDGLARFGAIRIQGRDASSFLHSQLTNEVNELEVGDGNLNARVKRTGHLVESFSLHRLSDVGEMGSFLMLGELEGVRRIAQDLDQYLFADEVEITEEPGDWLAIQGGDAGPILDEVIGADTDWSELAEHSVVEGADSRVVVRSLTGDRGYLVSLNSQDRETFLKLADAAGLQVLDGADLSGVLETLRLEAGQLRVVADCEGRDRLLPETGLEQHAVSYTKGCYLGQEVIARVRTYGSVPFALRGLVLQAEESAEGVLSSLPSPGEDLRIDGKVVGSVGARVQSPVLEAPIALAYLNRASRTPGQELQFECGVTAKVMLLPFYRAPDAEARVAFLYDRAIRVFAEGDEPGALDLLADALRLEPTFADAYELIGVILGRSGRYHEAIDFFRRLEEVAPDEPMVHTNLSLYYMKIGDRTQAEEEAAKATTKQFRTVRWQSKSASEIADDQQQSKLKEASRKKAMFAQVLEIDAEDSIALFGMGSTLAVLGEHEEACVHLARAAEVDASNSAVYLRWGRSLEALSCELDAVEVYRKGMDVASRRGDLMPLREMEHRVLILEAGLVS